MINPPFAWSICVSFSVPYLLQLIHKNKLEAIRVFRDGAGAEGSQVRKDRNKIRTRQDKTRLEGPLATAIALASRAHSTEACPQK